MNDQRFWWRNREIITMGDLLWVMSEITGAYEAYLFMEAYRSVCEYADENVGYTTGYFSKDTMVQKLALFNVKHPVFGSADVAAAITPEAAFRMGEELGNRIKSTSQMAPVQSVMPESVQTRKITIRER